MEWIKDDLIEGQDFFRTQEGIGIIPHHIIEDKLDKLCSNWSTVNFRYQYLILNGNEAISASIELKLPGVETRTLTGAVTYSLDFLKNMDKMIYGEARNTNEHYTATAKSLAIVNAAKPIGRQFGKYLNRPESLK